MTIVHELCCTARPAISRHQPSSTVSPSTPQSVSPVTPSVVQERKTVVQIGGKTVPVTCDSSIDVATLEKVLREYKPFQEWVERMGKNERLVVRGVHVQNVDLFGPRVGFLKFKADVFNEGKFVPGIVFMRGGAVAVLVVLSCEGQEFCLLTVQPRVPIGDFECVELPAGMLDGNGAFAGVAAKEMKEETGLEIKEEELIDLGELAWKNKFQGMLPSPGGCDEFIRLYLYRRKITRKELESLEGKATGVLEEGEMIKLKVIPFDELWAYTADSKALCASFLYEKLKGKGYFQDLKQNKL